MIRFFLAVAIVTVSTTAFAQQTRNQAAAAGAAGVTSRLQSQGYKDVQDLRRMPDGKWVGTAMRNGHPVTVTSDQAGTTIAR
ncbi:MAG: PepSY domain-containing protein [Reyranellales bacterium]